jgi:hypothetical protein
VQQLMAPDFPAMRQLHARARHGYRNAAAALLAGGLLLAAAGIGLQGAPRLALLVPGLVAASLAVLPLAAMVERGERIQGLAFLEEEWRGLRQPALPRPARSWRPWSAASIAGQGAAEGRARCATLGGDLHERADPGSGAES